MSDGRSRRLIRRRGFTTDAYVGNRSWKTVQIYDELEDARERLSYHQVEKFDDGAKTSSVNKKNVTPRQSSSGSKILRAISSVKASHPAIMTTSNQPLPSLFCAIGSENAVLREEEIRREIGRFLDALGPRDEFLLLPPDFTRYHSQAGVIARLICEHINFIPSETRQKDDKSSDTLEGETKATIPSVQILPALGTHAPMTTGEIEKMFGRELAQKNSPSPFFVHDWRNDVVTIGHVPAQMVQDATHGMVQNRTWPAQLNELVWSKRKELYADKETPPLVLSIGQVVPHEVMGMANFNKNLFVGTGGVEAINLSHFIGAVHGMENMMGRQSNPLRDILNYASEHFLQKELDLWYILTVVSPDEEHGLALRGLYIGKDIQCYSRACDLSLKVNFTMLPQPVSRVVVYLDSEEFKSTWLGNKAIYRTRMAMADNGHLLVLAPGVCRFGEDDKVDELIRQFGYKGTPATIKAMEENAELRENLSAVAHLIHGSSEGRFRVTYAPGHLTREETERVGFDYAHLKEMESRYDISKLNDGWNSDDEGDFFFIRNPALGLWAVKERFEKQSI